MEIRATGKTRHPQRQAGATTSLVRRIQEYNDLAKIGEIARRYFAMNAFDGVLTIIGVLMGNLTAGVRDARIVVTTGLATCVAMGVSGLWGAYLTESAERKRNLSELSRQTLTDLNHTRIGRASRTAAITVSVVDGLSPFLAAFVVLIPFYAVDALPTMVWAYYISIGFALLTLFCLGLFLGHTSKERLLPYGIKTVIAGVASIAISMVLGAQH
jgi:predicted membrane protein (TIGR00267 family)